MANFCLGLGDGIPLLPRPVVTQLFSKNIVVRLVFSILLILSVSFQVCRSSLPRKKRKREESPPKDAIIPSSDENILHKLAQLRRRVGHDNCMYIVFYIFLCP